MRNNLHVAGASTVQDGGVSTKLELDFGLSAPSLSFDDDDDDDDDDEDDKDDCVW